MRLKMRRFSMIDTGGVYADRLDLSLIDQPPRRFWRQSGKGKGRHPYLTAQISAQVFCNVRPVLPKTGSNKYDGSVGYRPVPGLPCFEIIYGYLVIAIASNRLANVDHDCAADQLLQWYFIDAIGVRREMNGCIDMGAAVFRGPEGLRGIIVALFRHALEVSGH